MLQPGAQHTRARRTRIAGDASLGIQIHEGLLHQGDGPGAHRPPDEGLLYGCDVQPWLGGRAHDQAGLFDLAVGHPQSACDHHITRATLNATKHRLVPVLVGRKVHGHHDLALGGILAQAVLDTIPTLGGLLSPVLDARPQNHQGGQDLEAPAGGNATDGDPGPNLRRPMRASLGQAGVVLADQDIVRELVKGSHRAKPGAKAAHLNARQVWDSAQVNDVVWRLLQLVQDLHDARPEWVQQTLREALKLSTVTVIQSVIGGGRSCRAEVPVQLAAHAALCAIRIGKPVKLQLSRTEQLRYTAKRHPLQVTLRTQVDEVGRLHRVEARLLLDGGAYATSSAQALETVILHALGPYHCDSVYVHGVVVATNRPPNAALAEFDIAAMHFCIERQMDQIANSRTLNPVAVRKVNVLRGGDSLHTGDVLRWAVGVEVVETAERLAKAPLVAVRRPGPAKSLPGQGVGLSLCCLQPQGGGAVSVELRGEKIRLLVPYVDAGEGHPTRFAVLVSRALKVPISSVVVRPMDTSRIQPSMASPPEIQLALGRVVQRLVKIVAQEVGSRSSDFARLLKKRTSTKRIRVEEPILPREGLSVAFHAAIVDLLVDPDTGEVTLRRIVTTSAGRRPVHARSRRSSWREPSVAPSARPCPRSWRLAPRALGASAEWVAFPRQAPCLSWSPNSSWPPTLWGQLSPRTAWAERSWVPSPKPLNKPPAR